MEAKLGVPLKPSTSKFRNFLGVLGGPKLGPYDDERRFSL